MHAGLRLPGVCRVSDRATHRSPRPTTRGRRTAQRRKRYHVPRLREGVMLFQSSLPTHAAQSHSPQLDTQILFTTGEEVNGHFKTTQGDFTLRTGTATLQPRTQLCGLQSETGLCWLTLFRCRPTTHTPQFDKRSTRTRKVRLPRFSFIHSLWNNFIHCVIFKGSSNADWSSRFFHLLILW